MLGNNSLIRKLCYLLLKITAFENPLNTRYWSLIWWNTIVNTSILGIGVLGVYVLHIAGKRSSGKFRSTMYQFVFVHFPLQDHLQLDINIICVTIFPMVQVNPTISIKVLQRSVEARYDFKTLYRKVWLAKQKVIAEVYGNWKESYNELLRWFQAL